MLLIGKRRSAAERLVRTPPLQLGKYAAILGLVIDTQVQHLAYAMGFMHRDFDRPDRLVVCALQWRQCFFNAGNTEPIVATGGLCTPSVVPRPPQIALATQNAESLYT